MKFLKESVVSLALAFAAGMAAAGTVSFAEARQDATGRYSHSYTLNLDHASLFSAWFKATADVFENALTLDKVTLSQAGQSFVFDRNQDGTAFTSVKAVVSSVYDPDLELEYDFWNTTYTLSPVQLAAGEWDVKLDLVQSGVKVFTSISGGGTLSNAVPEPQSLGLVALALAGVALVRRRRVAVGGVQSTVL